MSILIRCPLHMDDTPSLSINVEKGVYKCFGCREQGDLFSLAVLAGNTVAEAVKMAYGEGDGTFAGLAGPQRMTGSYSPLLGTPTEKASGWLRKRGVEINERGQIINIEAGRLPYFEEGDMVLGISVWCPVIRDIGDEYGHPIPEIVWESWRYYRVMRRRKEFGKYFATLGFPRGRCLGLAGEVPAGDALYVGEGVLDGLAILLGQSQKGIPQGTAYYTFGARVTRDQTILIRSLLEGKRLILAFDNDESGFDATFAMLRVFPEAEVLVYTGKDPGEGLLAPEPWEIKDGLEWLHGRTVEGGERCGQG